MTDHSAHLGTKAGTIGGTLLTIIMNIDAADLLRTAMLATVGAVVSFTISLFLKWFVKAMKRRREPK
jgi:mannitol-specific phosphotransferase system IIBC component